MTTLLPLALLGGVAGLDVVSFPQAMFSRPVVASTMAGALAGDAAAGLLVGAMLEMFAMEILPVGAARYPEWGSAAVVGGALAAGAPRMDAGGYLLALLAALATAWAGGGGMHALRRLIGRWIVRSASRLEGGDVRRVMSIQLRGLTADFLRAAITVAAAVWLARLAAPRLIGRLAPIAWLLIAAVAAIGAAVAGATAWRLAAGARLARWIALAGLGVGFALASGWIAAVLA